MDISIVIPAHNAAKFLASTIDLIQRELDSSAFSYEILIMENGSTDATPELARELSKDPKIKHNLNAKTPGKGKAISDGILQAKGRYVCFCDADLEISPEHIIPLVDALKEGYEISVVSKRHPQSVTRSPVYRTFLSLGYNLLVRLLFQTSLHSHQDGLKAFNKEAVTRILSFIKDDGWFWDTELIVYSRWAGYRIKEIPIDCDYGWESTFDPVKGFFYFFPRLCSLLIRAHSTRKQIRASAKSN